MLFSEARDDPAFAEFWRAHRRCLLTSVRPDGSPHAVLVGATLDLEHDLLRVITRRGSRKVAHVRAGPADGARVSVAQVEGGRWCAVEGLAVVRQDAESVAEAERRHAERYRAPRPHPERVVIEISPRRVLGRW